jgi:hypothetical protein
MRKILVLIFIISCTQTTFGQDNQVLWDREFIITPQQSSNAIESVLNILAKTPIIRNANPPFELSYRTSQGHVPNKQEYYPIGFQVFVDDFELGRVDASSEVQGLVAQQQFVIQESTYIFTLELVRMRVAEPPKVRFYGQEFSGEGKRLIRATIRILVERL